MSSPIPNVTGGAATSGDVRTGTDIDFGPVTVGGLFGSSASSSQNEFLMPALIVGGAIVAWLIFQRRK